MTENTLDAEKVAAEIYRVINARVNKAGDLPRCFITSVCRDIAAILGARAMQAAMAAPAEVEVEALMEFARGRIREAWEGCEDGDEIQDHARRLGLIVEVPGGYDPERHGTQGEAEPGEPWFVFADWLKTDAIEDAGAREGAEALGRFGHHPNPAIDFEVEVEEIEAEWSNLRLGFTNGTPTLDVLTERVAKAMGFRVGGDEGAVNAKAKLRKVEADLKQPPTPAGAGDLVERWWRDFLEKDDRTSPEEYPEMILVSFDEIKDFAEEVRDEAASRIEALEAEVARYKRLLDLEAADHDAASTRATAAEAERDALRAEVERKDKALRNIAEGNLGDGPGQANYDRVRSVALAALAPAKGG